MREAAGGDAAQKEVAAPREQLAFSARDGELLAEACGLVLARELLALSAPDERDQFKTQGELEAFVSGLEKEMKAAALNMEFERAAALRDRVKRLRSPAPSPQLANRG